MLRQHDDAQAADTVSSRIQGLDTLRFVLAVVVVLNHVGLFPLFHGLKTTDGFGWLARSVYYAGFSAPAAVIVFFVISGFCIHYPFRHQPIRSVGPFYVRRYIRIAIPLFVAVLVFQGTGRDLSLFGESILWSLHAELIYYTLYPLLLAVKKFIGWPRLLVTTFLLSGLVAMSNPTAANYPSYGLLLNWLLGLPCWLLGCRLAEDADSLVNPVSGGKIWTWRLVAWVSSCVCLLLRFHTPVGYPWSLGVFGIIAYLWLRQEICYFRRVRPPRMLEWAGAWSYSLYLMHIPAAVIFGMLPFTVGEPHGEWLAKYSFLLFFCYCFFRVIERPSHLLARALGRHMEQRAARSIDSEVVETKKVA